MKVADAWSSVNQKYYNTRLEELKVNNDHAYRMKELGTEPEPEIKLDFTPSVEQRLMLKIGKLELEQVITKELLELALASDRKEEICDFLDILQSEVDDETIATSIRVFCNNIKFPERKDSNDSVYSRR
jgi:hypothetical protein